LDGCATQFGSLVNAQYSNMYDVLRAISYNVAKGVYMDALNPKK